MKHLLRLINPKTAALLLAAAAFALPNSAEAVIYTYTGTLATTNPTYNRPLSATSLSSVGTAVYYNVQAFTLTLSGSVNLSVDSATFTPTPADDSYLVLYQNSFNPATPLANIVAIDDDSGPGALSLITATLTAGTQYFLVTSPYYNATTGPFQDSITPANTIAVVIPGVAVPEPGTLALCGLSIFALGGLVRRRVRRS